MDRSYIISMLAGLLVLLITMVVTYFVREAKEDARRREQRRDHLAQRERLAEQRMAENGGQPLSSREVTTGEKTSSKRRV